MGELVNRVQVLGRQFCRSATILSKGKKFSKFAGLGEFSGQGFDNFVDVNFLTCAESFRIFGARGLQNQNPKAQQNPAVGGNNGRAQGTMAKVLQ